MKKMKLVGIAIIIYAFLCVGSNAFVHQNPPNAGLTAFASSKRLIWQKNSEYPVGQVHFSKWEMQGSPEEPGPKTGLNKLLSSCVSKGLSAALIFSLLTGVMPSMAVESGGRFGGGGFPTESRSSFEKTGSESRINRVAPVERSASLGDGPVPKRVVSRESEGPTFNRAARLRDAGPATGGGGSRQSPDRGVSSFRPQDMLTKTDLLVLGGGATATAGWALANRGDKSARAGGGGRPLAPGGGPVTTCLQVGLYCDRGAPGNTLARLAEIGRGVDPGSRESLGQATAEACLALLRQRAAWVSGDLYVTQDAPGDYEACERRFKQLAIGERAKWSKDTFVNTPQSKVGVDAGAPAKEVAPGGPTYAVVTLLAAWDGRLPPAVANEQVRNPKSLGEVLDVLSTEAVANKSKNLLSLEVLWTPEQKNDVLTRSEMVEQWPGLIDL